ncbi:hypothetical protein HYH03_005501 [Edaphochlamys debaryana]|uniref:Geranylgeranyl transferase type-2 subunit alpha n=1 Tax=Edaphochlamys debaryana TaxID=47281 RepID=A0A835Y7N3_9CHLO|nr:hypothetical protein HYH03_005501 [Edaphochlamys debaryana]|eukprot:KAG2496268.1 hypothetical protein HYH03_005501 [Edaphochlamys debaryana]
MHGRPREYKNKLKNDHKAQEAYKKKVDAIRNGTALVLEYRKQRKYEPAILDASAKLLKVVPEIYTLWNYRREALEPAFAAGGEAAQKASEGELALTQAALMDNPKSYSAWHHRKWVVAKGLASLDRELAVISKALDEDQRNFHAWNYRRFIVDRMGRPPQDELQYTEEKIIQNFSNYSAWHTRTILLHQMYGGGGTAAAPAAAGPGAAEASPSGTADAAAGPGPGPGGFGLGVVASTRGSASQRTPIPHDVLDGEYDMVHQAFATDARDQSPWMYYRWLVGNTLAHLQPPAAAAAAERPAGSSDSAGAGEASGSGPGEGQPGAGAAAAGAEGEGDAQAEARLLVGAVLEREAARMRSDHLAADPDAKWPLLTLARLREAQARLGLAGSAEECAAAAAEARELYGRLAAVDPMRRGFYEDAAEGRAFVVVQALGTV